MIHFNKLLVGVSVAGLFEKRMRALIWFVFIFLCSICSGEAATLYVDKDSHGGRCSDSNPGSIAKPLCTIQKAQEKGKVGDTFLIRKGIYEITSPIKPKSGQTWKVYEYESVTILGDSAKFVFQLHEVENVIIAGFVLDGAQKHGIYAFNSKNISVLDSIVTDWNKSNEDYRHGIMYSACIGGRIAHNEIYGGNPDSSGGHRTIGGIVMGGSHSHSLYTGGTLVENNYVHGNQVAKGIWADVRSGSPNYPGGKHIWQNNIVKNVTYQGLRIETGSSAIMRNNIVIGAGRHGIGLRACTNIDGTQIINNVVYKPKWFGLYIAETKKCAGAKSKNLMVKNNIFYLSNRYNALVVQENSANDSANVFTHNLFFNTKGVAPICWRQPFGSGSLRCQTSKGAVEYSHRQLDSFHSDNSGSGSIWANPLFTDPDNNEFQLKRGSPGCNAGEGGVNMGAYTDTGCGEE